MFSLKIWCQVTKNKVLVRINDMNLVPAITKYAAKMLIVEVFIIATFNIKCDENRKPVHLFNKTFIPFKQMLLL